MRQLSFLPLTLPRWKLVKLFSLTFCLGLYGCEAEEEKNQQAGNFDESCNISASETLRAQESALDERLRELGDGSDELHIRTAELGQLYALGAMLNNGNRLRNVDGVATNSLEPQALRDVSFNAQRTAFDTETSSYGALVGYYGVGVAAQLTESEGQSVEFEAGLTITDLTLHAINDVNAMIDSNRLRSPNAHQFVYGVFYGNVRTEMSFKVACQELSENSAGIVYEYFEANASFAVNLGESSANRFILESREPVPIAYLIREFEPVSPVTNLSTTVNEGPEIALEWDYIGPSTRFRVYYSQSANFAVDDEGVLHTDVEQAKFSFSQQLELGESWHFRVATVSGGKPGAASEAITVTIPASWPTVPLVLLGDPLGSGHVKLRWGRPEGNSANLYTVFRRESVDEPWVEYKTFSQDNPAQKENFRLREFIDTEVSLGKTYYYQIAYSNWLSPPNAPPSQAVAVKVVDQIIVNNEAPVAEAGPVTFVNENDTVQLNGSNSYDPDSARALNYAWQASPENPVEVSISDRNKAVASIVAPEVDEALVSLEFILTVSDGATSSSDTVQINVQNVVAVPVDNKPPKAFLKTPKISVREGDMIILDASDSTDPDGDALTFSWRQFNDNGIELDLADKTEAKLEINAPFDLIEDREITFVVIVSDGELSDTEQVTIALESRGEINSGLELKIDTQHSPLQVGEGTLWSFEVANTSSFSRENVQLEVFYPHGPMAELFNSYISKGGACATPGRGDRCDTQGEVIRWNLGTLAAGQGLRVSFPPVVASTASPDSSVIINARVSDDFGTTDSDSAQVALIGNRWLQLHLAADKNPIAPGEHQRYTLSYGFNETSNLASNTQLSFSLPEGLVFVSASDNGQVADRVVTWALGDLLPGESSDVTVTVKADDSLALGSLLRGEATLRSENIQGGIASLANLVTRVEADVPISLASRRLTDPILSEEGVDTYLRVANHSQEDIHALTLYTRYPTDAQQRSKLYLSQGGDCLSRNGCYARDWVRWDIPTLRAGESKVFSFSPLINPNRRPADLVRLSPWLEYNNRTVHTGGQALRVADNKPLVVAIHPQTNALIPGSNTPVEVSYRFNSESSQAENVVLTLHLPPAFNVSNISGNGIYSGQTISWALGNLQPEAPWGSVGFHLGTPATASIGSIPALQAKLKDENGALAVAQINLPVSAPQGLNIHINPGPKPARFGDKQHIELVVNNSSRFPRSDVKVSLRYPSEWADMHNGFVSNAGGCFDRLGNASLCDANSEWITWTLPTLAAESATTLSFSPRILADTTVDNQITLVAKARDSSGVESESSEVIPLVSQSTLNVSADATSPVKPGEVFTLDIPVALNTAGEALNSLTMSLPLPEGVSFVSASHGGTLDQNANGRGNRLTWSLNALSPGNHYPVKATLQTVNDAQLHGQTLTFAPILSHSSLAGQNRYGAAAKAIVAVEAQRSLNLSSEFASPTLQAGGAATVNITVTNTSPFSRANINVRMRFPAAFSPVINSAIEGGACEQRLGNASYCDATGEFVRWHIPALSAGEQINFSFSATVAEDLEAGSIVTLNTEASDATTFTRTSTSAVTVTAE